jgi:hypothetical protein
LDTLLRYLNLFHLAPSPSSVQLIFRGIKASSGDAELYTYLYKKIILDIVKKMSQAIVLFLMISLANP